MEWLEADPLPIECQHCQEDDCYNCDYAGKRWYLSEEDELRVRRKMFYKAIERLQRKIDDIDKRLAQIDIQDDEPESPMTQEIWEHCLFVCIQDGDTEQYNKLWNEYPELAANMIHEFEEVVAKNIYHSTDDEKQVSWERLKARLREEHGKDFI